MAETATTKPHHGPAMADGDALLQHHFDDLQQQHDSSTLGMWAFLATEVMFFGGLITAYIAYRALYFEAFVAASRHLSVVLGGINTAVLLISSLTMAMAVRSAQLRQSREAVRYLLATMALGTIFLGIKAVEWTRDYEEHLIPGIRWHWDPGESAASRADERLPLAGAGESPAKAGYPPQPSEFTSGRRNTFEVVEKVAAMPGAHEQMFFVLYFFMTGLHAIHLIIGIGVVGLIAYLVHRDWFTGGGALQIEVTGLYWHFIDIVWVFLYPLLYLIEVHS
jgi:cytochrome c oxidase subunit 3